MAMLAMLATSFVACDKSDDDSNNDDNINVVDLGLPSGIKWAKMNVGATNPWDFGNYYAWGETETKSDYNWETYKYCNGNYNKITKYCNKADCGNDGFTDTLVTLESADDVATAVLGADYSMPTAVDWNELCSQCYWVWTSKYEGRDISGYIVYKAKSDGDKGVKVFGDGTPSAIYSLTDVHIFLPAAGYIGVGRYGCYWSSSLYGSSLASNCSFDSNGVYSSWTSDRCFGWSVRPVKRP